MSDSGVEFGGKEAVRTPLWGAETQPVTGYLLRAETLPPMLDAALRTPLALPVLWQGASKLKCPRKLINS